MSDWISVKDRLPENDDNYLILFEYGRYRFNERVIVGFYSNNKWCVSGHSNNLDTVTHWMPLPEPPKDNQ